MTTRTDALTTGSRLTKFLIILGSLLLGMFGSAVMLGLVWILMTRTPLAASLGALLGISAKTPWYLSRSAGTVAYLLLTGSTIWGLLLSTKIVKEAVPAALALAMHNILSWLAVGFTGFHAVMLLFDNYFTYSLADLTIPFIGPYRPEWVGLGIIAFYTMVLTSISFYFRKQIGQKWWRRLHYLTFAVFFLGTAHGLAAGTDSSKPGMYALYLGSGLLVFFLTSFRLLTGKPKTVKQRQVIG